MATHCCVPPTATSAGRIWKFDPAADDPEEVAAVEAARRDLAAYYVGSRRSAAYVHEETLEYREQYPGRLEWNLHMYRSF